MCLTSQCGQLPAPHRVGFGRHVCFLVPAKHSSCIIQISGFLGNFLILGVQLVLFRIFIADLFLTGLQAIHAHDTIQVTESLTKLIQLPPIMNKDLDIPFENTILGING